MKNWTANEILELSRSYQAAAVIAAAAELELYNLMTPGPWKAEELAAELRVEARGLVVLLDALAALGLLNKIEDQYVAPTEVTKFLAADSPHSLVAMAQHQANCLRRWAQLARVIKTGKPAEREPSVRGEKADEAAFIGAMHELSALSAGEVIRAIKPLRFNHLLDVGGASGTWTAAFLWACHSATATLVDLRHVVPMARRQLTEAGFAERVKLVVGDYLVDPLPAGADLAWISAIVHQNSREQNRRLFANVFQALENGGRIAIRDVVMEEGRTRPVAGALFAINMLVGTDGGSTYTFEEVRQDLEAAGFKEPVLARRDPGMNSVIVAKKSAGS